MQRTLASLLLALVSFSLIGPLLVADTASNLPACCRRDGKHHCAMLDMIDRQDSPADPAMKAVQTKCTLFPRAVVVPAYSKIVILSAPPRVGPPTFLSSAAQVPSENRPSIFSGASVNKRGPPTNLDCL